MTADPVHVRGQGGVPGAETLLAAYLGKAGSGAEVCGRAAARVRQGEGDAAATAVGSGGTEIGVTPLGRRLIVPARGRGF